MIRILVTIFAGLLGLAFGSFLNVCLTRWPEGESIVSPRSHCRQCSHTLTWWENVPLVSWLALRGRCRSCQALIGWRYPLVESAVAALWATAVWRFSDWSVISEMPEQTLYLEVLRTLGRMIFYWLLVALAALDAEHLWLPDWLTWPGMILGFAFSIIPLPFNGTFATFRWGQNVHLQAAIASLMSVLIAAGLILIIRWVYWLIRRREGIGLGDAKLMALLAAWLGLPGSLLAFGLGVVLGALAALVMLAIPAERTETDGWALQKLPLGTFLCIGGIISALWGHPIIAAYRHWSGF